MQKEEIQIEESYISHGRQRHGFGMEKERKDNTVLWKGRRRQCPLV